MKRTIFSTLLLVCLSLSLIAQGKAKYVFYFIGDGMGVNQINGTETYLAALEGRIGITPLCFTQFPYTGLVTTFSATNGVTDSAAGGTALAIGNKTKNGAIGVKADLTTNVKSVAEKADASGKAVGIATSVSIDHATPASFYAHVRDRGMYHQIGKQLIAADFDFYAGSDFLQPENKKKSEEKDLYTQCHEAGYVIARGYKDFGKKAKKAQKMILLQTEEASKKERGSIPYAIDRNENDLSLEEITQAGINFLYKKNPNGFFLMVEGGKIDWACHSNDAATVFREVIDFDKAIKNAYDFYQKHPDETLIVVTADHETGGISLGTGAYEIHTDLLQYQNKSAETFSKLVAAKHQQAGSEFSWELTRQLLQEHFGFWTNIALSEKETNQLKNAHNAFCEGVAKDTRTLYASENVIASAARKLLAQKAMIGWTSKGHSNGYVPVFAIGVGAECFTGRIDNTEIPEKIAQVAGYAQ